MNFSEEQLKLIEQMAGLFFPPEVITVNLELHGDEAEQFVLAIACEDTAVPFVAAYFKGRLESELVLRDAIRKSALNGSSPSQQMMLNFYKDSKL